jgi:hypothetical protein
MHTPRSSCSVWPGLYARTRYRGRSSPLAHTGFRGSRTTVAEMRSNKTCQSAPARWASFLASACATLRRHAGGLVTHPGHPAPVHAVKKHRRRCQFIKSCLAIQHNNLLSKYGTTFSYTKFINPGASPHVPAQASASARVTEGGQLHPAAPRCDGMFAVRQIQSGFTDNGFIPRIGAWRTFSARLGGFCIEGSPSQGDAFGGAAAPPRSKRPGKARSRRCWKRRRR